MSQRGYRRRRLIVLLSAVGLLGTVLVVVLATGGAGSHAPHYLPAGGRASVPASPPGKLAVSAPPAWKPAPAAVRAAAELPLARQVGQLFLVALTGTGPDAGARLAGSGWGGVVLRRGNYTSPGQLRALTAALDSALGVGGRVAPLVAAAQEGGRASAFPDLPPKGEAALGAAGDAATVQAQARLAALRLRALGVSMTLAPLADVDVPTGALSDRLFSTDPSTVARFTGQAVDGYLAGGLISAPAHFPGEGSASADPDQELATVGGSLAALRARDLVPFAAVASRAPVIELSNAAYAAFDGVTPASLLSDAVALLRDELHFQGVVMSGDLEATLGPSVANPGVAAVDALAAGDDLLLVDGPPADQQAAYTAVLSAARHSAAIRTQVRDALLRDLTLKARYGLLH